jgi:hypothetical protein
MRMIGHVDASGGADLAGDMRLDKNIVHGSGGVRHGRAAGHGLVLNGQGVVQSPSEGQGPALVMIMSSRRA